jgi:hypothetical protein
MKLPKNMEIKNIILLLVFVFLLYSCKEFKGEKIELNYKDGYVKILSNEYVIDSLVVNNHMSNYYIIGLSDKSKGSNIVYFRKENLNYNIYQDSLEYYCSKFPNVEVPGLEIIIRRKGYLEKDEGKDYKNIEYFGYNQIPCNSILLDTINARSPYK